MLTGCLSLGVCECFVIRIIIRAWAYVCAFSLLRQSSFPVINQSSIMGSSSPYTQPMNNNSSLMNPQVPTYNMAPNMVNSSTGNRGSRFRNRCFFKGWMGPKVSPWQLYSCSKTVLYKFQNIQLLYQIFDILLHLLKFLYCFLLLCPFWMLDGLKREYLIH